jgi:hypothetical protein
MWELMERFGGIQRGRGGNSDNIVDIFAEHI